VFAFDKARARARQPGLTAAGHVIGPATTVRGELAFAMNRKERRAAAKSGRPQAAPNSYSNQLRELGDRHLKAGDLAEAESLYRQALAGDPADLATLHRLGHVATRSGRAEEALGLYRRAPPPHPPGPQPPLRPAPAFPPRPTPPPTPTP